jgi:hypothetical protein
LKELKAFIFEVKQFKTGFIAINYPEVKLLAPEFDI